LAAAAEAGAEAAGAAGSSFLPQPTRAALAATVDAAASCSSQRLEISVMGALSGGVGCGEIIRL